MERQQLWGGEVLRVSAATVLTGAGLPGARVPGEVLGEALRVADRELVLADLATREPVRLQDTEVQECLTTVGRLSHSLSRERLRLACEVAARSLHQQSGHRLEDWLAMVCPDLTGPPLHDTCRIALASTESVHAPLVAAVLDGTMQLARAAKIHRALTRVRKVLDPDEYALAVDLLVQAGCEPLFGEVEIDKIIARLLARVLPEKDHEAREKKKHQARNLHESSLADGTLRRIIITFGSDDPRRGGSHRAGR